MLAPFPRNPTWSSLAYKASAVASGSKGAFVSSLRFFASGSRMSASPPATCMRVRIPATGGQSVVAIQLLKNSGHGAAAPAAKTKRPGCLRDPGPGPLNGGGAYALAPPPGSSLFVSRFIGCLCPTASTPAFQTESERRPPPTKRRGKHV